MSLGISCISLALKHCGAGCQSASTSELDGTPSRILIKLCLCEPILGIVGEGNVWDPLSLTVDGDSSTWTITGLDSDDGDKCYVWEVSGGPLSYGQSITLHYDADDPGQTWSGFDDFSVNVINTILSDASAFLLESGDYLLLESGDRLLLEA